MTKLECAESNGALKSELARLNRIVAILRSCKHTLLHASDEGYLLTEVCRVMVEFGGYLFCWVGLAEEDAERSVQPVAFWGDDNTYLDTLPISWADSGPGSQTPAGTAIRTRKPFRMGQLHLTDQGGSWRMAALERGFQAVLSLPLSTGTTHAPLGAFTVYTAEAKGFEEDESALLAELANDIAHGIENLRRHRERRRVKVALKMAEARYSGVLENTGTGTILIENDEFISFCNATFEKMTGHPREAIVGKRKWSDFMVPEDARRMENYHVWRRTEPGRAPSVYECQMLNREGEKRDILMKVGMVEGTRISVASFMDITEAKQARNLLHERDAQLAAIVEHFSGPVFIRDMKGRVTFTNKSLTKYTGYNPSGEYCHAMLFDRKTPCPDCPAELVFAGKTVRREVFHPNSGRWFEGIFAPIPQSDGTIARIQAVFTNISDRKAMESTLIAREETLRQENQRLRSSMQDRWRFGGLVGKSEVMQGIYEQILKAAASPSNVIVYGASGTGKELTARAIHDMSDRASGPFIPVNCGAISESLIESAFFGHRKGAFTGANQDRQGFLSAANGGTLFLDEVGEIPLSMQVKLLRALDDGGFTPVGATHTVTPDIRIVAATNRNLYEHLQNHRIREDFFYRIHIIPIRLPALKDRKEDLPLLIEHFFQKYAADKNHPPITGKLLEAFTNHPWTGNVRELQNVVQRYLSLQSLDFLGERDADVKKEAGAPALEGAPLKERVEAYEKELIVEALNASQWSRENAADLMGIHRKTLFTKMKKYGLLE